MLARQVKVKYNGSQQPVFELSGGNQQKVLFARALQGAPELLLLDEPTRGVDIGAKYEIYTLVRELSDNGCSIIISSSDLPEILGMCDRILILSDGRQTGLLEKCSLTSGDLLTNIYSSDLR
jgi:ribose transport system ATP-binding protein